MKHEPIESLDPELDELLSEERVAPAPTDASFARVRTRLAIAIPALGQGGGGGSGEGAAGSGESALPTPTGGGASIAKAFSATALASRAIVIAVAAFAAGSVVGAGLYASLRSPPPERVVFVDRIVPGPAAPPAVQAPAAPESVAPTASSEPPIARARTLSLRPAAPTGSPSGRASARGTLAAERALLDEARAMIVDGRATDSLAVLDRHAATFPLARLREEREALAIQALVLLGRGADARERAAEFRRATPTSMFLPAIEASLASIR